MSVKTTARSDELTEIRQLFAENDTFSQLGQLVQIDLILDANAVLADLRWLVCKAKNPSARTNLIEAIDAETIIAYAPTFLEIEIKKNIPIIANEENVDETLFFEQWEMFRQKINFIESGGPVDGAIDPKDMPYVNLHNATGYPILSEDSHISRMGAKAVSIQVTASALDYSRNAVVEYKIKIGALRAFIITGNMIQAASELIRSLGKALSRIPPWAWLLVVAGFAFILSIECIRFWLKEKISSLPDASKKYGLKLISILEPIMLEYQERKMLAKLAESKLLSEIE